MQGIHDWPHCGNIHGNNNLYLEFITRAFTCDGSNHSKLTMNSDVFDNLFVGRVASRTVYVHLSPIKHTIIESINVVKHGQAVYWNGIIPFHSIPPPHSIK